MGAAPEDGGWGHRGGPADGGWSHKGWARRRWLRAWGLRQTTVTEATGAVPANSGNNGVGPEDSACHGGWAIKARVP